MAILGDGKTNIYHNDSLQDISKYPQRFTEKIKFGSVDIITTNPPFGTKIDITDKEGIKYVKDTPITIAGNSNTRAELIRAEIDEDNLLIYGTAVSDVSAVFAVPEGTVTTAEGFVSAGAEEPAGSVTAMVVVSTISVSPG